MHTRSIYNTRKVFQIGFIMSTHGQGGALRYSKLHYEMTVSVRMSAGLPITKYQLVRAWARRPFIHHVKKHSGRLDALGTGFLLRPAPGLPPRPAPLRQDKVQKQRALLLSSFPGLRKSSPEAPSTLPFQFLVKTRTHFHSCTGMRNRGPPLPHSNYLDLNVVNQPHSPYVI